jgi:chromosome segregation ATPase
MNDLSLTSLIITAALTFLTSLVGGGWFTRWTMRKQEQTVVEADAAGKRADAAATLVNATLAEVDLYRKISSDLQKQVSEFHGLVLGAQAEAHKLRNELDSMTYKLAANESHLLAVRSELEDARADLNRLRESHSLTQEKLEKSIERIRKAERNYARCEEEKAGLLLQLEGFRASAAAISKGADDDAKL